tara:strand:- start:501 stop:680 length:180 start_codon:yes stop_codon:yes gene_type:complete
MTDDLLRKILTSRMELENRIKELGGEIPQRWPWDDTGELRNTQLIEHVEKLERIRGIKP